MYVKVTNPDSRSWSLDHVGEIFEVYSKGTTYNRTYHVVGPRSKGKHNGAWFDSWEVEVLENRGFGIKYKIKKHEI
jgi:hypothetical protein